MTIFRVDRGTGRNPARPVRPPLARARRAFAAWSASLMLGLQISTGPVHAESAAGQAERVRYVVDVPEGLRNLVEARLGARRTGDEDEFVLRRRLAQTLAESRDALQALGLYAAKVEAGLREENGIWIVRFAVTPGPQMNVCSVDLTVSGAVTQGDDDRQLAERLRSTWMLPVSSPFRHVDWEAAKAALLKAARQRRFAGARLSESRVDADIETHCAHLRVTLDSGPVVSFGPLEVQGLQRYDTRIVQNLNPAREGADFDSDALLRFQLALQQTGFFSSVSVSASTSLDRPSVAPVVVRVEEQRLKAFSVGAGYSTNTGYRGQLDYVQNAILDRPIRLSAALKLESLAQSARGDLSWPREESGWQWIVGSRIERKDVQDVVTRTHASYIQRQKAAEHIDRQWTLGYFTEDRTVGGGSASVNRTLALQYGWTLRRLKPSLFPEEGFALTVQWGGASRAILAEQDFLRAYGKAVWLVPVDASTFVTLRGEAGIVAARSREGIPLDFLFRTGGSASVRGYGYESLGVIEGSAVVGGRVLAVGSLEATRWLTRQWGAAVFFDIGGASDTWQSYKPSIGVGAGARLRTPVGPLSLDLAQARDTRTLRLHFNLSIPF